MFTTPQDPVLANLARLRRAQNLAERHEALVFTALSQGRTPPPPPPAAVAAAAATAAPFSVGGFAWPRPSMPSWTIDWRPPRLALGARARWSVAATALPATAVLALAIYPYLAPNSLTDRFFEQDRLSTALTIEDASGNWLGVANTPMTAQLRQSQQASYLTSPVEAPQSFIRPLYALEDRNIGSWRSVHGVDILAQRHLILSGLRGSGPGGSPLAFQLERSLEGINPVAGSRWSRARRKMREFFYGPLLYHRLGGAKDPRFQSYLGKHVPLAIGAHDSKMGTPLHGVELTARTLWHIPAAKLSRAQGAILAAAFRAPIILASESSPAQLAERDRRWNTIKARAIDGLNLAYKGSPFLSADIREVEAMAPPSSRRAGFSVRGPHSEDDLFHAWSSPEQRLIALANADTKAAYVQVIQGVGRDQARDVQTIRLSTRQGVNSAFRHDIRNHLNAIEHNLKGQGMPALTGKDAQADIVLALVKDGRVVRYYSNMQDSSFYGSSYERDQDGRFDLTRAQRPIGSLGKVPLAVLFGQKDAPSTKYCNEMIAGGTIHNAGSDAGGSCALSDSWMTATMAFGDSKNLPMIWRLKGVADNKLRGWAKRYQLQVPAGQSPRYVLPLGTASARPSDLMSMITAVGAGASGGSARAVGPSMVSSYKDAQGQWKPAPAQPTLDLSGDFAAPSVSQFISAVLSAPLREGGTLEGLSDAVPGARYHLGKSGTTEAAVKGHDRGKWALGTFRKNGATYSYLMMIDARNRQAGLGVKIGWRPFIPMLRRLVRPN